MGPGEAIAALALFVGMPWVVFSGIAKIKAASMGAGSGGGAQLRKSELQALIEVAVEDATEPLVRRIETLEAIAIDEQGHQDRLDAAVLADALDPDAFDDEVPAAARRRTRS